MSEQQADRIIARFNEGQQSRNFSAAVAEITAAQRANPNFWREQGERVNAGVDFSALGFNTDFQVLGVNNRGQLVTSDDGGTTQQRRAGTRLGVVGQDTAPSTGDLWGNNGRRFQSDSEGRQTFTIRQGDYLDRVARDVLSHNTGRTPTDQDVVRARQAIATENRLTNPNNIPIGTTLRIPESLVNRNGAPGVPGRAGDVPPPPPPPPGETARPGEAARPGQPPRPGTTGEAAARGMRVEQVQAAPENGVYHPLSPPGIGAPLPWGASTDGYREGDRTGETTRREAGRNITEYNRSIGWLWNNVQARVREEVIPGTNVLDRRTINYNGSGAEFYVRNASGGHELLRNVSQVDVYRDAASGQYTTTYTMRDGSRMRTHVTPDGRPYTFAPVGR